MRALELKEFGFFCQLEVGAKVKRHCARFLLDVVHEQVHVRGVSRDARSRAGGGGTGGGTRPSCSSDEMKWFPETKL